VLVAAVGIGLSTLATVLVVRDLDLARTAEIVAGAQPALLIAGLALIAGQAILRALRWQVLLPHRGDGRRVPLASVAMAMLVGYLGNSVLPARLGELIRAAVVAGREAIEVPVALGSALLERVIDVFVLALFGVVAAAAISAPGWVGTASITAALVGGAALLVIAVAAVVAARRPPATGQPRAPRILGWSRFARVAGGLAAGGRIVDRPGAVVLASVLTVGAWVLDTTVIWCVARSIGIDLSFGGAMLVSVVAVLSTAIPTAPGYIGTFELAAVAAVGISGVTGEAALAFALLAHAIAVLPLSIAGAVSLWLLGAPSLRGLAASARTRAPSPR
jgi:uncharacterized membrane protein YbhN (UPF0104 family)